MASFRAATILISLSPVLASAAAALGPARVLVAAAQTPRQGPNTIAAISEVRATSKGKFLHQANKKRAGADVYYVAEALDKLKVATTKQQMNAEARYNLEEERLQAAVTEAQLPADRSLLETTVEKTEENKMEEMNAFKAMYNMYFTMKSIFGAVNTAPTCEFLTCGEHARCNSKDGVAWCECKPCFEGNGFLCKPSTCSPTKRFTAQPMAMYLKEVPAMEDVTVAVYQTNRIVAAFRDAKQGGRGFLLLGEAKEAKIEWGQLQPFSGDLPVYDPQIVVNPIGRIVVEWRDKPTAGTGYLLGGSVDEKDPYKAIMLKPTGFVRGQAEKAALVQLETYRVVCLYSHPATTTEKAYGGAMFVQVLKGGSLSIMGKYRFADHQITNIRAVQLRPSSFVVAYRDPPLLDESANSYSRELSVVWVGMQDDELIVDPHPIVIDAETKDMGLRDVALVSENLFAYSYQSNAEKKTKMAVVRVDPDTHRMKVTDKPKTLASGDTPFVKSISVPFASLAPHTLTYVQKPGKNSVAETCRITPKGLIEDCQELPWANTRVSSVTGTRLGDGRLVFVFADEKKDPFYQMLGAPGN